MNDVVTIFDRRAVRAHRDRAALAPASARFLDHAVRERLVDRLDEVRRRFALVLDLGCGDGRLAAMLRQGGHEAEVISFDIAPRFAMRGANPVVGEAEFLPFAPASIDLAIASLVLHWTNDLPGALWQLRRVIKPDGLLLAALWGGETLRELRESLMQADLEVSGGAGPRVSPFTDVRDAGMLLQRAGFALPVVDAEMLTVTYPDMFALIRDLRAMGETNAVALRGKGFTSRTTLLRAAEIYAERFADGDSRIRASFQLLTLTGWAPHDSQPKPLRPGSAAHSLAEALKSSLPKA